MELPDEKYSLEVRRIVAEEAARASFDEVVELVKKQSGAEVPSDKRRNWRSAPRATSTSSTGASCASLKRRPPPGLELRRQGIATLHRDLREATRKAAEATDKAQVAVAAARAANPSASIGALLSAEAREILSRMATQKGLKQSFVALSTRAQMCSPCVGSGALVGRPV
jgi:hypothetical protein